MILGGGPGGYEAALVAAQLGAQVTVVDSDGLGGACVLTDCVPSKTLVATAETMGLLHGAAGLGIAVADGRPPGGEARGPGLIQADAPRLYARVKSLAQAQSADVAGRLAAEGVEVITGHGQLAGPHAVAVGGREIGADVVLIATGGMPRVLPDAEPDGERILTWRQLYDLTEVPPELIVVGSGVTGAEFASAIPSPAAPCSRPIVSAVATSVFDGTQSVSTQAPPSPSESTTVTCAPSCAATSAAS